VTWESLTFLRLQSFFGLLDALGVSSPTVREKATATLASYVEKNDVRAVCELRDCVDLPPDT
jgi:hypothetical protein